MNDHDKQPPTPQMSVGGAAEESPLAALVTPYCGGARRPRNAEGLEGALPLPAPYTRRKPNRGRTQAIWDLNKTKMAAFRFSKRRLSGVPRGAPWSAGTSSMYCRTVSPTARLRDNVKPLRRFTIARGGGSQGAGENRRKDRIGLGGGLRAGRTHPPWGSPTFKRSLISEPVASAQPIDVFYAGEAERGQAKGGSIRPPPGSRKWMTAARWWTGASRSSASRYRRSKGYTSATTGEARASARSRSHDLGAGGPGWGVGKGMGI